MCDNVTWLVQTLNQLMTVLLLTRETELFCSLHCSCFTLASAVLHLSVGRA
jgi:hypothetical protein